MPQSLNQGRAMACSKGCGTGLDQIERMLQGFDATGCLKAAAPPCQLTQLLHLFCRDRAAETIARLQRGRSSIEGRFGSKRQLLWGELIHVQNNGHG